MTAAVIMLSPQPLKTEVSQDQLGKEVQHSAPVCMAGAGLN